MVSVIQTVDTSHEDLIHDAQLDFYGTMLATASSDCSVKIFSIKDKKQTLLADLRGHQGPVWGVSWSHPLFGGLLASCSYDKTVIIWQQSNGKWSKLFTHQAHESSVNSVSWAPHELGLALACASSDGSITILQAIKNGDWNIYSIHDAHPSGVNAVSWAPVVNIHALLNPSGSSFEMVKRIVSGGCDCLIKIWRHDGDGNWVEEARLDGHQDWVRDVAWAPSLTDQRQQIASCGQDGQVIIWKRYISQPNQSSMNKWDRTVIHEAQETVWHVSWNLTGNMLAVSAADNTVTLWKENLEGRWIVLSHLQRGHVMSNRAAQLTGGQPQNSQQQAAHPATQPPMPAMNASTGMPSMMMLPQFGAGGGMHYQHQSGSNNNTGLYGAAI